MPSNKTPLLGGPAPCGPGIPTGVPFAGVLSSCLVQYEKFFYFFLKSQIKKTFFVVYTGKTTFWRQKMNDLLNIENKILVIRGQQVMLDRDLAEIYGYETPNNGSS